MTSRDRADLAILGGGPAGLTAAWRTAAAGHRVVVLEREAHVGGATRSIEVGGVRADLGSHRLHRAINPALLRALAGLLGEDLQRRPRRGRIRLAGRWLAFPLRAGDLLRGLPPGFAAQAALDAVTAPLRGDGSASFDARVRARLGDAMADRFYGPYARKLWGLDPTEIDARQADVRISATSPGAIVRKLLRDDDPDAGTFLYPRRGFGQISAVLASAAADAGAQIATNRTVTALECDRGGWTVTSGDGQNLAAARVWSTVPLPVLARLAAGAPPEVVAAARELRTRAMVLVYLVLGVPRLTRFDAHYLPESWTPITRLSEPKNYRDGTTGPDPDPPDRTVLCAELPCDRGDELWTADDDELAAMVQGTVARTELPTAAVLEVATHRLPNAYPIYDRGFQSRVDLIDDWARSRPGLLTFGRQGLFVHDNTHHTMAMAWAAADALGSDGTFDEAAWTAARDRFAEHVVED